MDEILCGYWVSRGPDDPNAHVCAKDALVVARPGVTRPNGDDEIAYCMRHATEERMARLKAAGWVLIWLD